LSINRVIGLIEKYPDLQSTKGFIYLQTQLTGTERRIKVSRDDFNGAVAQYNKLVRGFPSGMVASLFGFRTKEGFQSVAGAETPPEIKF
ncbi:MAG TPA: LemA family protein, partial [Puia sp.]|nr:LemA family protein [Puia sp.]